MEQMLKILIVDDDEVDRMAVRRALKIAGVISVIEEAEGCADAIAALEKQKFDVALVDFRLPDGDGFELLKWGRSLGISVPMIILTGQGDEETAVGLMKAGAADYFAKSKLSPDTLSHCLYRSIRLHRSEIQAQLATQRQQESEERYRLVLEGSNDGIWDWDIATNEIYWNDRFLEIVGLPRSQRVGTLEAFYQLLHPDDRQPVHASIQAHLATGEPYSTELRLRHGSGEYRYCTCRGKAQRNAQGIPVRMAGIISDITERKQTEKELIQQHQRSQLYAELTLKIRESLQITEILQTTVREVRQLLHADRVLIYQLFADGSGTVVTEAVLPGVPVILGQNIVDPCFRETYMEKYRQGRITAIADLNTSQIQPCHIELLQKFAVKANLVVPIIESEKTIENSSATIQNQTRLWGLLIAHQCTAARHWEDSEIELLQQLANQVSIAIAQANAMQQVSAMLAQQTEISQQLSAKNIALESALTDLQNTQTQLIQAEKMSGLGQLVAGVAHEINNPITFIYGNLTPAQQYIEDLLQFIQLYQKHYPQPHPEIASATEALELDFLIADLIKIFSSMKVGAERIRTIVQSLRNFSRSDEAQMKPVDIHEGLDNTLLLLQHRLNDDAENPKIQIIKKYSKLPRIECYPQQLNQAFMNIVSNGIDALQKSENPTIEIRTEVKQDHAVIRIIDNGPGMTPEVNQRIFDPFFTTKPVGSGTGLGLSISYQIIVEKHGGELQCVSTLNNGTEFIIRLPIQPQQVARSLGKKNSHPPFNSEAKSLEKISQVNL